MHLEFDLQNIFENEGIAISIVGMSIVFLGLVCVSLYILWMPKFLVWYDSLRAGGTAGAHGSLESEPQVDSTRESEILAAITLVLEAAMSDDDGTASQRITIRRTRAESIWREAGHMRSLSSNLNR